MTTTALASTLTGRRLATAIAALAIALLTSCASPDTGRTADPAIESAPVPSTDALDPPADRVTPTTVATASTRPSMPTRAVSTVGALTVVDAPGSATVIAELPAVTSFGSTRVLLVEQVVAGWVQVELPVRPNETKGWVRSDQVRLEELDHIVIVDLATRRLTVWVDGRVRTETDVAVGSPENPTPAGSFYVVDKVDTTNDHGAYGPFALGLSAFSDTLTEFGGGEGQIGLHGTNDPGSIGNAVSHGCVRLPNDMIIQLATDLPLGTPVVIS